VIFRNVWFNKLYEWRRVMKKKLALIVVAVTMLLTVGTPVSNANVTVEFSEVDLPSLTLLDGTAHFAPWGLGFGDTTYYSVDMRLPPAGSDDRGITTTSGNDIMTVIFSPGVISVTADWAVIGDTQITATAYSAMGSVLDTQSATGNPPLSIPFDTSHGSFTFLGPGGIGIAKITFGGGPGAISVGKLEYMPIPAPGAILLGGIGVCLIGWLRRHRTL
jgi:hypothetical protein